MPRVTEARANARREQIIRAATTCFARNGFHRTTMQQICKEAKLSPGSVYSWFPSKRAIIREMTTRRLRTFEEALAVAEDHPHRAVDLYLATVERAATDPAVGRLNIHLVADANRDRFGREVLRTITAEGVAVLKRAFRKLQPRARADADARARLLQAAAFGIVIQSLIDPKGDVASLELAQELISPSA
jgi:AcrR family transcriptional regulator